MQRHDLNVSRWAKQAGVSEGAVRNFLAGRSASLNARTYDLLAAAADVPVHTLISEADLGVGNTSPGPAIVQYLPLISWVRAGEWTEIADPCEPGTYEKLILVTRRYSNRAYALRLDGDSMQAPDGDSFPSGSIICVEPMQHAKNGSYVVIRLESSNEATFKQLIIDGDRQYLKPLNPRYPIMEITEPATICGVVRQLVMDFDR